MSQPEEQIGGQEPAVLSPAAAAQDPEPAQSTAGAGAGAGAGNSNSNSNSNEVEQQGTGEEIKNDTNHSTEEIIISEDDDEVEEGVLNDEEDYDAAQHQKPSSRQSLDGESIIEEEFIEEEYYDEEEYVEEEIVEDGTMDEDFEEEIILDESQASLNLEEGEERVIRDESQVSPPRDGEEFKTSSSPSAAEQGQQQNASQTQSEASPSVQGEAFAESSSVYGVAEESTDVSQPTETSPDTETSGYGDGETEQTPGSSDFERESTTMRPNQLDPEGDATGTTTDEDNLEDDFVTEDAIFGSTTVTSTEQDDKSPFDVDPFADPQRTSDLEDQRADPVAPVPALASDDDDDDDDDKPPSLGIKKQKPISPVWYWLGCLLILAVLGAGGYVGYYLTNETGEDDTPQIEDDDEASPAPTQAPTVGFTTEFDPIQGNCDFMGLKQPHVIDQCVCVGEIQIIAEDVRGRYASHREIFIPTLYRAYDEDITSCSARNQALVWLSSANDYEFSRDERVQRFALASIYAGLGGANWADNSNWLLMSDACLWAGVKCNADRNLKRLVLEGNNAIGTLAPEVALLEKMTHLLAARNDIEGFIPEGLFAIAPLRIVDLSFNRLTGPIPPTVGDAKRLLELSLENNFLSGRLSQQLGGATNLALLNLASNQLQGVLPIELFDLSALTQFNIRSNELEGSIPPEISKLSLLTSLILGPNLFSGEIQTSISELTNLRQLSIEDMAIGGRLPAAFGANLKELVELVIKDTNVNGNIETFFGDLPKLVKLDLSGNTLRGSIPSELGNLLNLVILDLGNNFLDGEIPDSFGNMFAMGEMQLNDNLLVGGIPNTLGFLNELQILRLDGNQLQGRVADEVCGLRNKDLFEFLVDCPIRLDSGVTLGVVCNVPTCCTECRLEE